MYKIVQSENHRFTLSFLANWKLGNYSGRGKFMLRGKFMPQHLYKLFLTLRIEIGT